MTIRGKWWTKVFALVVAIALTCGVVSSAQTLPPDVCKTLQTARAAVGHAPPLSSAELGAVLNRGAWTHRGDGWGLLAKSTGNHCVMPSGMLVSCDYLLRAGVGWDVLSDSDGAAKVECGEGTPGMTGWVAPVDPGDIEPPAPPPGPPPAPPAGDGNLAAILARLDAFAPQLESARAESYNAAVRTLEIEATLKTLEDKLTLIQAMLVAQDQAPPSWVKDPKTWILIGAGIAAGVIAAVRGGSAAPAPAGGTVP